MEKPIIKIIDLRVTFADREIFNSVNIDFLPKTINVVMGKSGIGKTTLLRSINRLNECFAGHKTTGTILVNLDANDSYINIYDKATSVNDLRKKIGMVFQQPNVLPCSIIKNLSIPLNNISHIAKKNIQEKIQRTLLEVDLWDEVKDRLHHNANILSGGEQQRLCLARALILEPQILLLDEPTSSIDLPTTEKIENLFKKLSKRITLLVVSHDELQAERIATGKIFSLCLSKVA
ncbi:MAG: phosphate ABC transporter ATP-binding protein [Oligoflexia bacterium]|nr:phosphate ABC transporter ATP-binding protein [Oligoflexia bacterium]